MATRREFLFIAAGMSIGLTLGLPVFARSGPRLMKSMAIARVYGDGIRLVGIALHYSQPIAGGSLSPADFSVTDRTVISVFTSRSADPEERSSAGDYVIIMLSPDDKNAPLAEKITTGKTPGDAALAGKPPQGGPGKAGDIPVYDTRHRNAEATFIQRGELLTTSGTPLPAEKAQLTTQGAKNLIVDEFKQFEFHDPQTGRVLKYNLFIPEAARKASKQKWPLVLFMHDAGATSDVVRTTLYQGLGAICWASPEDQQQRPCFVLAPQFEEIIADDDSHTSAMLEVTINLINHLCRTNPVDRSRLYTTGQSGGCMMSIAMDIKYPDFFAASLLVAGQWSPDLVKPLARQKLWIIVSQDDDKAWPGQNAIIGVLEKEGAKVARAVWEGNWDKQQFSDAFRKLDAEHAPVNYVTFSKGSVLPPGDSRQGASGHRNTWRIAYSIEPVREWIFRQHK